MILMCPNCELLSIVGLTDEARRMNETFADKNVSEDEKRAMAMRYEIVAARAGEAIDGFNQCCERIEAMG